MPVLFPHANEAFLAGYANFDAGRGGAVALAEALLTLDSPAKVATAQALLDWPTEQQGPHHGDLIQTLLGSADRRDRLQPLQHHALPLLLATPLTAEEAEDLLLDHFEGAYPPGKEAQAARFLDVLLAVAPKKAVPQALAGIWARGDALSNLAQITQDKAYGDLSQVRLLQHARHTVPAIAEHLDRLWPWREDVVASWISERGLWPDAPAWPDERRWHLAGMHAVQMEEVFEIVERLIEEETQGHPDLHHAAVLRIGGVIQAEMADIPWAQGWRETALFHPVLTTERAQALQDRPASAPRPSARRRT